MNCAVLVRIGVAAKLLGCCTKSLRRWDDDGTFKASIRTPGGHRRYDMKELERFLENNGLIEHQKGQEKAMPERAVGYARVSSAKQRDDLERQKQHLHDYIKQRGWQEEAIYSDVASGLNDQRGGLKKLLQHCQTGTIDRVVVTYDDRLARFGTHVLEFVLKLFGVTLERIEVVCLTKDLEKELLDDLLALMTSFTGRLHRMRRGRAKKAMAVLKDTMTGVMTLSVA